MLLRRGPRLQITAAVFLLTGLALASVLIARELPLADEASDRKAGSVSRCVERFLRKPNRSEVSRQDLRRYVQRAYCQPFARRGWVHEDGTLNIAAYTSGISECGRSTPGGKTETVPCPPDPVLDCALLDLVRRGEAQAYVERLAAQTRVAVQCDDGRRLSEIGAT